MQLNRFANAFASLIPTFFLGFSLALTNRPLKKNLIFALSFVTPIFCIALINNPVFIPSVEPKAGLLNYPNPGPIFILYTVHFFLVATYGEIILLSYLNNTKLPAHQKKSGYLIWAGSTLGFLLGSTAFFTVYNFTITPYPSCFVWIFAFSGTVAIARYNLFGIQININEIPYFIVVGISTLLYLSCSFFFTKFITTTLDIRSYTAHLLTFLLCGLLLRPLQGAFEYITSYLLFKSTTRQLRDLNHNLFERIEKDRRLSETSILAAGMAHEIKNPLTTLKTFSKYLPDRYQDPDFIKKCALHMQEETDRINNIVLQILEFASPKIIEPSEVDLHQLVNETLSMLNINLVKHNITASNFVPDKTMILLDKNRFRQVLVNLFLNAIDACPSGGLINISSEIIRRSFKSGTLISVSDTGIGMSEEELMRLYDPFYSHNKENGTGLGMNIVKRIIQDHGGQITVESIPHKGTTFRIFIPN